MKIGDLVKVINVGTIHESFYDAESCLNETATVTEDIFYDIDNGWTCAIEFDNSDLQCFQGVYVKLTDLVPIDKEVTVMNFIQAYTGLELKPHELKMFENYLKDMYK